jgi:ATP-binding cassette subfamily B protein IrtB
MPDVTMSTETTPRWRDLIALLAPVRGKLVGAAALQGLAAAASIVPLVCVVEIARRLLASPEPDEGTIRTLVVVAVAAFSFRLIAQGISSQITHLADNTFQLEVRRRVTERLGRLPLGWFGARHSGEVKRAVQDDVAAMHYLVAHSLPDLVAGVVAPVLSLGYLVAIDWRLTLVTIAPLLVFGAFYTAIVRGYSAQMAGHAAALGRIDASVVEFVQGIAVVKAFGRSHRAHERFARSAEEFADFHDAWVAPIARRSALGELACSPPVMLLVVLAGATALVSWGGMEPVDVIAFALLGLGLTAPLLTLGYSAQGFRLAAEAGSRVAALLATPELPDPPSSAALTPASGAIALDEVAFSYDGRTDVLRAISADLQPGTVTALVGPSGAGKSTLAMLIPRFWDVKGGAVRVGGADVRDVNARDLYAQVAFVFQESGLLRATLRDNIRLARPDAAHADVEAAARAAQIHDRIAAFDRGYDAVVGEDARLSGGEAQRIAIARALMADRPILVLDEATAFADPESEATTWLAVLAAIAAAACAAFYAQAMLAHRLGGVVSRTIHRRLGDHVSALPLGWFGPQRAGELVRLSSQGVTDIMGAAGHLLRPMVAAMVTPATVALAMFFVDVRFAVATALTAPLIYAAHRWASRLARRAAVDVRSAAAEAGGRIVEFAQIQPVLRAYGRAGERHAQLDAALLAQHAARRRQLWQMSMGIVASSLAVQLAFLVVMVLGVDLALDGSIDVPELVALLVLVARFGQPLVEAADIVGALRVAQGSLSGVRRVLDTPVLPEPEPEPAPGAPARTPDGCGLRLRDVRFSYGDHLVLDGIDLDVAPRTMLALVGRSGAGKTTVARLIARFWDVDEGAVEIGGVDVRELRSETLMSHVSMVFQDVYLFDATIAENIRAGRPGASDDEVRAAASQAAVDEIVARLPDGWDTRVGEGGTALSGGERQRVSIARAILKDAPIVLLDEATAALDPESEAAIERALAALVADKTLVVIAHRLATVVAADQIAVLDGGRIAQRGTHAELLASGGLYADFWRERTRARGWRIAPEPA